MIITPMFEAYDIPNIVNQGINYTLAATSPSFLRPSAATITMRQLQLGVLASILRPRQRQRPRLYSGLAKQS